MNTDSTLRMLLKQYVDINESFQHAQHIVSEHKKIQEKLKELFETQGIDQYVMNEDGYIAVLSFKTGIMKRVDVTSLPQDIKDLYVKESITKRETFNIVQKPI